MTYWRLRHLCDSSCECKGATLDTVSLEATDHDFTDTAPIFNPEISTAPGDQCDSKDCEYFKIARHCASFLPCSGVLLQLNRMESQYAVLQVRARLSYVTFPT